MFAGRGVNFYGAPRAFHRDTPLEFGYARVARMFPKHHPSPAGTPRRFRERTTFFSRQGRIPSSFKIRLTVFLDGRGLSPLYSANNFRLHRPYPFGGLLQAKAIIFFLAWAP